MREKHQISECSVQGGEQHTGQYRGTVLRRENNRQRLEYWLGWRPFAYYQRLRVYYRRWRDFFPFRFASWTARFGHDPYTTWVHEETRALESAVACAEHSAAFATRPTVSVLVAVQGPHLSWLEENISSVLTQSYPNWELWLCEVETPAPVRSAIKRYLNQDARVKTASWPTASDPATVLNRALNVIGGEFVGLLGQHDTLSPHALFAVINRLQEAQGDIFYSDEDALDAAGKRSAPFFKPDWSPDLCLSSLYACNFGVYRRSLVEAVGGFRVESAESLQYDLLLRCVEQRTRIVHIPQVLYHKRHPVLRQSCSKRSHKEQEYDSVHRSAKQVLGKTLDRRDEAAVVEDGPLPYTFRVRRRLLGTPLVSIIIPTRDRSDLLRRCLESIEGRTTYRRYEILVVDNGSTEPETLAYLTSLSHQVIRDDGPFNFARLNNRAATLARGEHLLFLNNDVEVISPEWLAALLEHSQRQEIGAVGAQLLYADGTIQHAGVVLGVRGVAGHAHKYRLAKQVGYFAFPQLIRNYSAVTAACLMIRKAVYGEVGGMEEQLAVMFNDVDLCLRLRARGYLIVYTPYACLYHHESRSRWYQRPRPEEVQYMLDRWGAVLACDPYYNPHLTLSREDFSFDLDRARRLLSHTWALS